MRSLRWVVVVTFLGIRLASAQWLSHDGEKKSDVCFPRLQAFANTPSATPTIDVTYYKLDLAITVSPNYLRGHVTIAAQCRANRLDSIAIDLTSTLTVDSIKIENTSTSFIQHPSAVSINLNRRYGNGEMVVLDIFYRGVPSSSGFGSFAFGSHDNTPWVWTLSEPYGAKDWWPCNDHPLDKADSVDIWVTCRTDLKVASNGKLVGIVNNQDQTHTYKWAERYPIATYLVFVSLTNYSEFTNWFRYSPTDSMPVINYVLPEHLAEAQDSLPRVVNMLGVFSNMFGLYPFINEKYGHAEFGWGGAMEHQTMTSLVRSAFREPVLAHELAHHWFGDLITCASWKDIWLNEGFASYSEALYAEVAYGENAYSEAMYQTMQTAKTGVRSVIKSDTSVVGTLFDAVTTYRKGASVLHMLRHVLGDSVFFQSLRNYTSDPRFRYNVATSADFQGVCEATSGRSLEWFFEEWLHGENFPQYSLTWTSRAGANGFDVDIRITQATRTNNPPFFTMPIDIRLSAGTWDSTIVVFNDANPQLFSISSSHNPTAVELDPDNWILRETLPADELPGSFRLRQNYPNPFNGTTIIQYELPRSEQVMLKIFNILGQEIRTLVNEVEYPGLYRVPFDATGLPSGVYFYQLQTRTSSVTKKSILIR